MATGGTPTALLQALVASSRETTQAINNLSSYLRGSPPPGTTGPMPLSGMAQLVELTKQLVQNSTKATPTTEERLEPAARKFAATEELLTGFTGGTKQAITAPNIFEGVAGAVQAVGALAGVAPAVGPLIKAFTSLTATVVGMPAAFVAMSRQLMQTNFAIGQFSTQMGVVEARQEMRDINLSIQRGDALAPSAERLAQATNYADQQWAPIENAFTEWKNDIMTSFQHKRAFLAQHPILGAFAFSQAAIGNPIPWLAFSQAATDTAKNVPDTLAVFQAELEKIAGPWATIYGLPDRHGGRPRFIPPDVAGP